MNPLVIHNKKIDVQLTRNAEKALASRNSKLFVEMELYFSCLIRKQVLFHEQQRQPNSVDLSDKISVSFHPVMTKTCSVKDVDKEPDKTDFPIHNVESFVPKWLKLDNVAGSWIGEFGY